MGFPYVISGLFFSVIRKHDLVWCEKSENHHILLLCSIAFQSGLVHSYSLIFFLILERTQEEIERTKQFSKEVVDLLRHQPHFRMPFSKFIPSYHHHFGRQCKLAYYGFTKLLELFEAIPEVLQVSSTILSYIKCLADKICTTVCYSRSLLQFKLNCVLLMLASCL